MWLPWSSVIKQAIPLEQAANNDNDTAKHRRGWHVGSTKVIAALWLSFHSIKSQPMNWDNMLTHFVQKFNKHWATNPIR